MGDLVKEIDNLYYWYLRNQKTINTSIKTQLHIFLLHKYSVNGTRKSHYRKREKMKYLGSQVQLRNINRVIWRIFWCLLSAKLARIARRSQIQAVINSLLKPTQSPLKAQHASMHNSNVDSGYPGTRSKQNVIISMGSISVGTFTLLPHIVEVIESLDLDPRWNVTEPIFLHVRLHSSNNSFFVGLWGILTNRRWVTITWRATINSHALLWTIVRLWGSNISASTAARQVISYFLVFLFRIKDIISRSLLVRAMITSQFWVIRPSRILTI